MSIYVFDLMYSIVFYYLTDVALLSNMFYFAFLFFQNLHDVHIRTANPTTPITIATE